MQRGDGDLRVAGDVGGAACEARLVERGLVLGLSMAVCGAIALATSSCNRQPVGPAATADGAAPTGSNAGGGDASSSSDAATAQVDAGPPAIGAAGGVVEAAGGKLTIPPGAFRHDHVITMTAVTGDALKDWPRGTHVGFVFEPVDKTFRVPATIELPHAEGAGEVACWSRPGERLLFAFESAPAEKRFPIIVSSLPGRCAVYTAEHVCNATLCEALWRYQRNTSERIPAEERNTKAAAVAKVDVEKQLDILETSLKGKDYLVANAFSLVDVHVAGFAGYLQMVGFDVKRWPSVSSWIDRCRARPAFARAMGA